MKYLASVYGGMGASGALLQQVYLERWHMPALFLLLADTCARRELLQEKGTDFQLLVQRLYRKGHGAAVEDYASLWENVPEEVCGLLLVGSSGVFHPGKQHDIFLVQDSFGRKVLRKPFVEKQRFHTAIVEEGTRILLAGEDSMGNSMDRSVAEALASVKTESGLEACLREIYVQQQNSVDQEADRTTVGLHKTDAIGGIICVPDSSVGGNFCP